MARDWDRAIGRIEQAARVLAEEGTSVSDTPLSPQQRKALARAVNDAAGAVGVFKRAIQNSARP